jgi:hypothetical protein
MKRKHMILGGTLLAAAIAAGGGAYAVAGGGEEDKTLTGSTADKARAAALQYTGGGKAGVVEDESGDPEEKGASYGVEVTKPDGSKVDVFLDGKFEPLREASNEDG